MTKKERRQRQAENYIEANFPLPSSIDCRGLVDTGALMNAEKTLLSNTVLVGKGEDRKVAEEQLRALAQQRKALDELYLSKRCSDLELIDIEKKQLDALDAIRADDKSMTKNRFDNKTFLVLGGLVAVAFGVAFVMKRRG
jgi:hypothetical protein